MNRVIAFALIILAVNAVSQKAPLQFRSDGTFKMIQVRHFFVYLMQFTDLHYGETLENDLNTTRLMENIVGQENPDFLAFSGDMVAGIFPLFIPFRIQLEQD